MNGAGFSPAGAELLNGFAPSETEQQRRRRLQAIAAQTQSRLGTTSSPAGMALAGYGGSYGLAIGG